MKQALLAVSFAFALLSCATPTREQSLVSRAVDAMGGAERLAGIKTITFKGTAKYWEPEQSDAPGGEPRFANESTFEGILDAGARATRIDWVRNFAYPSPRTFTFSEIITPQAGYVIGIDSNGRNAQNLKSSPPAHSMSGLRLATAHRESRRSGTAGLVLAMHNNAKDVRPAADVVHQGRSHPAVSYGDFIVAFDPQSGLPALVRTLDYDNIWGDVNYDMVVSDWRDVGGVKIPMSRKYELNGRMVSDVNFTDLRFNQPIDTARLQIPADVLAGAAKPAARNVPYQWVIRRPFIGTYMDSDSVSFDTRGSQGLRLQEIAQGVHQVQGGTHNSLVVEMSDHLIVIDAPVTDAQSLWLVGATRARFPGKPIRWLALTHHHMDHAGGLRGILAEGGVTLVVGQGAGAHFRRVLEAPMTRNFDLPARSFHMTPILEVPESHVMSDARGRQVVVYVMENPHAKGMLMGWVPDAKLGFVTDVWTPGPPLPAKPNPGLASVVNTVKRAGLQPERFAGGHGGTADYQMLARLVGQ
jgi:glyoxylase-like metal-dependent hydrolase (beta-lactamase superfamily II)